MADNESRPWWRRLNKAALWFAVLAILTLVAAGPGHRYGLFPFTVALQVSLVAAVFAALALIVGLVALILGRTGTPQRFGFGQVTGIVVGGGMLAQFASVFMAATNVPQIHDITTNPEDPPLFVAVAPLRADAPNPIDYAGDEVAAEQRRAYPDIETLRVAAAPGEALAKAEAHAVAQGWDIVAMDTDAGRLEATATTAWYGYKDDVVIRVRAVDGGTDVDIRSKSRVGRSDLGANAERIRGVIDAMR